MYLGFAFQETDKSIKTVLLERLPLIRVRRGIRMQPLITKKLHLFGAQTQTLDSLCRICLEILLADDFYEESGICFGPNHQHSTTSSNQISSNLRENPIYAKFPCVTSRNQIVEEAYRARNQIKSNPIPADATFCMVCVKKITGGRPQIPELPQIPERDLRKVIEDRFNHSEHRIPIAKIGGRQGDPLTLLKIPSRKNRKGPLSRKQIRQKTNLLSDFRKYLFQTDYEIEQSLQTDQKLNLEHWEKAGCSYKIMNLDQQEELVKYLFKHGFTQNQIGDVARVHKMVTNKKLFKARKSIRLVKEKTLGSLHHEIETGVEYFKLKKKSDKIERKITYWRLKNPSTVVENWLNRDISKICFHTSQNPAKIQLSLTGDHFANTYGFYLGRANVLEPNSPLNFLPLACIAHSSDDREIIYKIIQPVIQNLMSLTEVDLDFSEF